MPATGNPGTATVNKAAMSPAGSSTDCQELDQANQNRRTELANRTSAQRLVGPEKKGRGTTVSSVKRTPLSGGRTKFRSAHNNHKALEKCPKTLSPGGSRSVRTGTTPTLCGNYSHPSPPSWAMQKSGHAEARLLDELMNGAPRRMTFNIDWRPKTGKASKMPCDACHRLICAALDCKHEITLCAKGNQPVPINQQHCPATDTSYAQLKADMGEDL
ncbi:hypothetical protein OU995_22240 [Roseateles sp. SL47]|jgi:hypothetical protein|uniref:hypothetical protein n=1 Tax=Roseateles sp. SL47 TaxID=2995138 RepID=UPI00226D477E|nr:hypothetical protein [Roseateles sp. SL47]WAC72253.1 hypothetical protein OU995_22240 [Roseateles sp. SL47]